MAPWRGSVTFATYTISPHYSQPALLTCQWNPTKRCLQRNLLIVLVLALLHRSLFFAQPATYIFTQNMLHRDKLHPVNWSAAAKNDAGVASRAHVHTPTSSSINSRFTQHMCVPLCWKRPALILNHARASPTKIKSATYLAHLYRGNVSRVSQQTRVLCQWQQALHKPHTPHALSFLRTRLWYGPARQMGSSFQFKVCSDLQGTKQSRIFY